MKKTYSNFKIFFHQNKFNHLMTFSKMFLKYPCIISNYISLNAQPFSGERHEKEHRKGTPTTCYSEYAPMYVYSHGFARLLFRNSFLGMTEVPTITCLALFVGYGRAEHESVATPSWVDPGQIHLTFGGCGRQHCAGASSCRSPGKRRCSVWQLAACSWDKWELFDQTAAGVLQALPACN